MCRDAQHTWHSITPHQQIFYKTENPTQEVKRYLNALKYISPNVLLWMLLLLNSFITSALTCFGLYIIKHCLLTLYINIEVMQK